MITTAQVEFALEQAKDGDDAAGMLRWLRDELGDDYNVIADAPIYHAPM